MTSAADTRAAGAGELPLQLDLAASVRIRVPFHDADPAGVAWHGNYLRWFDDARCALLDQIGYDYREMIRGGLYWPIVDVAIRYVRPVPYHTTIDVAARLLEWDYRLKIAYEVRDEAARRVASGHTVQVAVSAANGEMLIGAPDALRERLRAWWLRTRESASATPSSTQGPARR